MSNEIVLYEMHFECMHCRKQLVAKICEKKDISLMTLKELMNREEFELNDTPVLLKRGVLIIEKGSS